MGEFREQLEEVIQDEDMKEELLDELETIVPEQEGGVQAEDA
jgi:hypothetical protein